MSQSESQVNVTEQFSGKHAVAAAVSLIRQHANNRKPLPRLSAAARVVLSRHDWVGSREALDACIQRALVLCESDVIEVQHLDLAEEGNGSHRVRSTILSVLSNYEGARREAAAELGISARTLRHQLAELRANGVPVPAARRASLQLRQD